MQAIKVAFLIAGFLSTATPLLTSSKTDECFKYTELYDANRSWYYRPVKSTASNDSWIIPGWYRVLGSAGNSLKEGYERTVLYGYLPPYFCDADYPGTLMSSHPAVEEGIVPMTVCFRRRWCFFLRDNCDCNYKRTIYVRNCGKYYVYWLTPTGSSWKYCGTRSNGKEVRSLNDHVECTNYTLLRDWTRQWSNASWVTCDSFLNGWFRYSKVSGGQMQTKCFTTKDPPSYSTRPCGATFRGWMVGGHPSVKEGRVQRQVCFSNSYECSCRFYSNIMVRNCGDFHVYRIHGVPLCDARYCGANQNRRIGNINETVLTKDNETMLCKHYTRLKEEDRLWYNTDPTTKKCDASLYGNYVFGREGSPWKLKEGCNKHDAYASVHRCGTEFQGYLIGKHPSRKEGVAQRIVCFTDGSTPCSCQMTTLIKVQNCGSYYAYQLFGVPRCYARFCADGVDVKNKEQVAELNKKRGQESTNSATASSILQVRSNENADGLAANLSGDHFLLKVLAIISMIFLALVIICLSLLMYLVFTKRVLDNKGEYTLQITEVPKTPPPAAFYRKCNRSRAMSESSLPSVTPTRARKKSKDAEDYQNLGSRDTLSHYQAVVKV